MVQETGVQSQVASYQRLKKWYLIPPCLALSKIRYILRVKWSNQGKGVVPSPTSWCSSYWKGSLLVTNYSLLSRWSNSSPKFLQYSQEQVAGGIGLHVNTNKTGYMCFTWEGAIPSLSDRPLKLVNNTSTAISHPLKVMSTYALQKCGLPSIG